MDLSALRVARTLLYEQVWTTPMMKLAADYRITGTGLAKVCRKANIPVPPRGYWNKLQHGRPVIKRPPLPPVLNSHEETISIQPSGPPHGIDARVHERAAAELKPENRIQVGEQLRHPHPLVQAANAVLVKAAKDGCGMARTRIGSTDVGTVLDIRVSPAARNRALRLLDALLKALEGRGYVVTARGVTIEGEMVSLGIVEKEDKTLHVPTPAEMARKQQGGWERSSAWDYVPNGRLSIFTDAYVWWRKDLWKRWSDSRSTRLEDALNDVVIGLMAVGAALRERANEQRREAEARAERERRRQEQMRQARMEKARQENLVASTTEWVQAERIRKLVAAVEQRAAIDEAVDSGETAARVAWAMRVADELDPLGGGLDTLLAKHREVAEKAGALQPHNAYGYPGA